MLDVRAYTRGLKGPRKSKTYCDKELLRSYLSPPVFTVRSGAVWRQDLASCLQKAPTMFHWDPTCRGSRSVTGSAWRKLENKVLLLYPMWSGWGALIWRFRPPEKSGKSNMTLESTWENIRFKATSGDPRPPGFLDPSFQNITEKSQERIKKGRKWTRLQDFVYEPQIAIRCRPKHGQTQQGAEERKRKHAKGAQRGATERK